MWSHVPTKGPANCHLLSISSIVISSLTQDTSQPDMISVTDTVSDIWGIHHLQAEGVHEGGSQVAHEGVHEGVHEDGSQVAQM